MGRNSKGEWTLSWTPPQYSVGDDGKRIGYTNENTPNNWGRWGDDDEKGTTNFITPDVVKDAAGLISSGKTISCAVPVEAGGPVHPSRPGVVHMFGYSGADSVVGSALQTIAPGFQGADDYIFMPLQGSTQWDGLPHIFQDDVMYNGYWMGNVEGLGGAATCGIQNQKDTLTSRGVLLDLPRHQGIERSEPGVPITPDLLDDCAREQGVEIRRGDILLIRTGHVPWYYSLADKSEFWSAGAPGLSDSTVEWIHGKEIAALAVDNIAVEVEPAEDSDAQLYPVHVRLIRDLGLTIGEVWWLEDVAAECHAEGRWEFFLSAAPMNVTGGAGSLINPIAVF